LSIAAVLLMAALPSERASASAAFASEFALVYVLDEIATTARTISRLVPRMVRVGSSALAAQVVLVPPKPHNE
jgi:hypothetical protein